MYIKVVLDGQDLDALATFWCAVLGYEQLGIWDESYRSLRPAAGSSTGPALLLQRVPEQKAGKNRLHLDLHPDDGPGTVERVAALGATLVGNPNAEFLEAFGTTFQVMADPEGNEFCVVWRVQPLDRDLPSSAGL